MDELWLVSILLIRLNDTAFYMYEMYRNCGSTTNNVYMYSTNAHVNTMCISITVHYTVLAYPASHSGEQKGKGNTVCVCTKYFNSYYA